MQKYTDSQIIEAVKISHSRYETSRILGLPCNGHYNKIIQSHIDRLQLDISHFVSNASYRQKKYDIIEKSCPVCGNKFKTQANHPKEQTVCSISCSNTFFRSGENNPNWKEPGSHASDIGYRALCFKYHDKKCKICGWDISVDVHHIDGNHDNDDPSNVVPLCPNHHRMAHMTEYKDFIKEQILLCTADSTLLV